MCCINIVILAAVKISRKICRFKLNKPSCTWQEWKKCLLEHQSLYCSEEGYKLVYVGTEERAGYNLQDNILKQPLQIHNHPAPLQEHSKICHKTCHLIHHKTQNNSTYFFINKFLAFHPCNCNYYKN